MHDANAAINTLANQIWQYRLDRNGYWRAALGLPVYRLQPDSIEEVHEEVRAARDFQAALHGIDRATLNDNDRTTWDFIDYTLNAMQQNEALWFSRFSITPYSGMALMQLLQMVFMPYAFKNASDGDRYVSLMQDYAVGLNSIHEKLRLQAARGWRLPKPALPGAIAMLRGVADIANRSFVPERSRLNALTNASGVIAEAERILTSQLQPAFARVLTYLQEEYAPQAPDSVGLSQFPGGPAAYRQWLHFHLTEEASPEELHRLGLSEVAEITARMAKLRSSLGHLGGEAEFHQHLADTGRLYAKSADEVRKRYETCMARIEPRIGDFFSVLPKAPYGLQRLDPTSEAGMSYGYYKMPAGAGTTGYYMYNGSGLEDRCQITGAAIVYHELAPGHHFHIARQQENLVLPDIRRNALEFSVFNEGWAEYAAELAGEMGMYDDPYDRYGRLVHERFIAQRLVVDTGLNAFGWPLEKARAYMKTNTLESDKEVNTETLRYSTDLPGQSTAYRYGYLRFRSLRAKAEQALGSRFDIKAFHESILGAGALPLPVLEQSINRLIAS